MITINEGQSSYHDYELKDQNGERIDSAELLKYKLSDGAADLIPWTEIHPPNGYGTIMVAGHHNRVITPTRCRRVLTLLVVHGGGHILTAETEYRIKNLIGINQATEPTRD